MSLMRWDIINHLIKENNYKSYLEIGYYKGWSFDRVECRKKVAVDPNPSKTLEQEAMANRGFIFEKEDSIIIKRTSDDFFDSWVLGGNKFDIIFIDGLHESKQVTKDIENSLKHLSLGGTIVMHDCNPSSEEMTLGGTKNGEWTGDVYKAFIAFRGTHNNLAYVVDTDYGVGIIKDQPITGLHNAFKIDGKTIIISWEEFDKNRNFYLNLTSPEEFLKRETKVIPSSPLLVKQI